jgi:hypothetical protein
MSDTVVINPSASVVRALTCIDIPGDTLILDSVFCEEVLGGVSTRTSLRYEALGLPFVMVAGRKFRPLREGREWLAARIQRRGAGRQKMHGDKETV